MSIGPGLAIGMLLYALPQLEVRLPAAGPFEVGKAFEFVLETNDATVVLPAAPFEFGSFLVLEHRDLAGESLRRAYVAMPTLPGRQEAPALELSRTPGSSEPAVPTKPFTIDVASARQDEDPEWTDSIELIEPDPGRSIAAWLFALATAAGLLWWWRHRPRPIAPTATVGRESLDRVASILDSDSLPPPRIVEELADGLRSLMSERFACTAGHLTSEELLAVIGPGLRSASDLFAVLMIADDWKYGAVLPDADAWQRARRAASQVIEELRAESPR